MEFIFNLTNFWYDDVSRTSIWFSGFITDRVFSIPINRHFSKPGGRAHSWIPEFEFCLLFNFFLFCNNYFDWNFYRPFFFVFYSFFRYCFFAQFFVDIFEGKMDRITPYNFIGISINNQTSSIAERTNMNYDAVLPP